MGNRLSRGALRRAALMTMCVGAGVVRRSGGVLCGVVDHAGVVHELLGQPQARLGREEGRRAGPARLQLHLQQRDRRATRSSPTRRGDDGAAIQDFAPSPLVLRPTTRPRARPRRSPARGRSPPTASTATPGPISRRSPAATTSTGSIQLGQAYCKHLPTPAKGKTLRPGTPAITTARVQLIVTDWSGAQDGPFALRSPRPARRCPTGRPRRSRPRQPTKKAKSSKKASSKKHTTHASKRSAR